MPTTRNDPYEYADRQIVALRDEVNAEFQNARNFVNFDEINNIRTVKKYAVALYDRLYAYHIRMCRKVAKKAYREGILIAKKAGYEQPATMMTEAYIVSRLLRKYSNVTQYQYVKERVRKRDRYAEGVMSSRNRQDLVRTTNESANAWYRQAKQYVDMSVDDGRMQAFEDAGVERVQWVTEKDGKVCQTCKERDGQIFQIDKVPEKPHRNCRCHLIAVSRVK